MNFIGKIDGGHLLEIRELTTKDGSRVWRTVTKIAFLGGVCEGVLECPTTCVAGDIVVAQGQWGMDGMNNMNFTVNSLILKNSKASS